MSEKEIGLLEQPPSEVDETIGQLEKLAKNKRIDPGARKAREGAERAFS